MGEGGDRAGLALEAGAGLSVGREVLGEDLDGDVAAEGPSGRVVPRDDRVDLITRFARHEHQKAAVAAFS